MDQGRVAGGQLGFLSESGIGMHGRSFNTDGLQPAAADGAMPALPLPPLSAPGSGFMSGQTLQCQIEIITPQGFHMRPLAAFAEVATRFQSRVTVTKDSAGVDGKSPLALMGLAAEQGTRLLLEVSGPDAPAALDALMELLTRLAVAQKASDAPPPTP